MAKLAKANGKDGSASLFPILPQAPVGMARKLAVLLHRLWVTGEVYDPVYNRKATQTGRAAA